MTPPDLPEAVVEKLPCPFCRRPAALSTPAVMQLVEALEKAEAKFRAYAFMHAAKVRSEESAEDAAWNREAEAKADRNRQFADELAAALQPWRNDSKERK